MFVRFKTLLPILSLVCASTTFARSTDAAASLPAELAPVIEGTFEGSHDTKLMITHSGNSSVRSYFAVLSMNDGQQIGLFKVDALDASTIELTSINMGSRSILETTENAQPSFSGSYIMDGSHRSLILTATSTGASLRCPGSMQLTLEDNASEWISFSSPRVSDFSASNRNASIVLAGTHEALRQYSLTISGRSPSRFSGMFLVSEQIDGIGLARANAIDAMSVSGRSLQRGVDFVVVPFASGRHGMSMKIVSMQAGDNSCVKSATEL